MLGEDKYYSGMLYW